MHHIHNPLDREGHLLPDDGYKTLCDVRDKLAFLSQLIGAATTPDDHSDTLEVDRALFAQLFGDLSFQITVALEGTSPTSVPVAGVRPC